MECLLLVMCDLWSQPQSPARHHWLVSVCFQGLDDEYQEEGKLLGQYTYQEDGDSMQNFPVMVNTRNDINLYTLMCIHQQTHKKNLSPSCILYTTTDLWPLSGSFLLCQKSFFLNLILIQYLSLLTMSLLCLFLPSRRRTKGPSRSSRCGCWPTGVTPSTPASTASESTENHASSEGGWRPFELAVSGEMHIILSVYSTGHIFLNGGGWENRDLYIQVTSEVWGWVFDWC